MIDQPLPPLRYLEAFPVDENGERLIVLRDPMGHATETLTVTQAALSVLSLLDRPRTVQELIDATNEGFGFAPEPAEIEALVRAADEALMLDSPRYHAHRESVREAFYAAPTRPPALAGVSYPDDPADLRAELDRHLAIPRKGTLETVRAIAVPHIDFRIGAELMAAGWREVSGSDPELIVILGTGHHLADDFFACIDKDYQTPLGTIPTDRQTLALLEERFGEPIFDQAEGHRVEHSAEFAALFANHLFGNRPGITMLPILLSFPEQVWGLDHPTFNGPRIERFVEALAGAIAASGKRTLLVASIDFCHVGARFGDPAPLPPGSLVRLEQDDRALIETVIAGDRDAFQAQAMATNEENRVCGYPVLHMLLTLLGPSTRGELLGYRQSVEGERETVVGYAALAFS